MELQGAELDFCGTERCVGSSYRHGPAEIKCMGPVVLLATGLMDFFLTAGGP